MWRLGVTLAGIIALAFPLWCAETVLSGRVVNENSTPVAGARILLTSGPKVLREAIADPTGAFVIQVETPGEYAISAESHGYFQLRERPLRLVPGVNEISLVLNRLRETFESIDVIAPAAGLDFSKANSEEVLTGAEIMDIPYPTDHSLRNAMRLFANVVTDSAGGIHINGGAENQVLYTLDDFNITDPLTGRFESRLSVEAVRSLQVSSGGLPAEFGKGSAGAVAVKTPTGDDKVRYSATDFVPGLGDHKGIFLQDWTPRANFSGPLIKGRAWFSDSLDVQYFQQVVGELPKGQDQNSSWRVNNLVSGRVDLTPANILSAGYLANNWTAQRMGLSALDPIETTADMRSHQMFLYTKDQMYFGHGVLVEVGFAENRTFGHEIPQGHGLLLLTPEGERGNYFVDATRRAHREQWIADAFLPSFVRWGTHLVKVGVDLNRLGYRQDAQRTGYENFGADGTLLNRVTFAGSGRFSKSNFEASSFIEDSWKPRPKLLVELGVRQDWDEILRNMTFSPRLGVSWTPRSEATKISASYAIITDATNLEAFRRPLDQYSLFASFRRDGTVSGGPGATLYAFGSRRGWATPQYQNRGAALEQRLPANLYGRVNYLSRRGQNGFTYINTLGQIASPPAEAAQALGATHLDGIFELRNLRRDVFDSVEILVRQPFRQQYEWMASYTRSRALSNAVLDLSIDQPLRILNNFCRMPWDSPNRFLSWGRLPLPRKDWALAYMAESVIVDITALATLRLLGLTKVLSSTKYKFVISQRTWITFHEMLSTAKVSSAPSGSLSYEGGRPVLYEETADTKERRNREDEEFIRFLEKTTEVRSGVALATLEPSNRERLEKLFGQYGAEGMVLASEPDHVLWTDDLFQAQVAAQSFGIRRVWTQLVLGTLADTGLISSDEYSEASARLIGMEYLATSFDASTLLAGLKLAGWSPQRRPAAQFLSIFSDRSANLQQIFGIFVSFVAMLYREAISAADRCAITRPFLDALGGTVQGLASLESLRRLSSRVFGLNAVGERQFAECFDHWLRYRDKPAILPA